MKILLFTLSVFTLISCSQNSKSEALITENLKYSAYYWSRNQTTNKHELYLDHYINIDKNETFVLMRHESWKEDPKYFQGVVDSNVIRYINNAFAYDTFKTNYTFNTEVIYDGFDYCFDYKVKDGIRKEIEFIPPGSPEQIKLLGSLLESFIKYTRETAIDTLLLASYIDTLVETSTSKIPIQKLLKVNELKSK